MVLDSEITELEERAEKAEAQVRGYQKECNEVEQMLGKVLGYPWYKDDQKNFPDATEEDGVCVGEHVAGTIAAEAVNALAQAQAESAALRMAANFFASVIKSGEAWSDECQRAHDEINDPSKPAVARIMAVMGAAKKIHNHSAFCGAPIIECDCGYDDLRAVLKEQGDG